MNKEFAGTAKDYVSRTLASAAVMGMLAGGCSGGGGPTEDEQPSHSAGTPVMEFEPVNVSGRGKDLDYAAVHGITSRGRNLGYAARQELKCLCSNRHSILNPDLFSTSYFNRILNGEEGKPEIFCSESDTKDVTIGTDDTDGDGLIDRACCSGPEVHLSGRRQPLFGELHVEVWRSPIGKLDDKCNMVE